jgi:GNAT superfamily N-acetyltransferase
VSTPWKIEQTDFATAGEDVLRARYELDAAVRRESLPEDDEAPFDEVAAAWRLRHPKQPHTDFAVWGDDGRMVGFAEVGWEEYGDNAEMSFIGLDVAADKRRQGMGTQLLRSCVDVAEAAGRPLLFFDTHKNIPAGAAFMAAIGADHKFTGRYSILRFPEVDVAQLEGWVARAAERAADYELVGWVGACPDERAEAFVAEQSVMNTAPTENLEYEDEVFTIERLRDREARWAERGANWRTLVAVHTPTGEMVAHTDVMLPSKWPERAYQNDTGVNPAHREKGLGRWLKAQMLLDIMREQPAVTAITTFNAGSNDAMLGINYAMGFRTIGEFPSYQARADVVRPNLESRLA